MATSAEGSSSQVIGNPLTGANDATASSGEDGRGMTVQGHILSLTGPLTVIDPDSGKAQLPR